MLQALDLLESPAVQPDALGVLLPLHPDRPAQAAELAFEIPLLSPEPALQGVQQQVRERALGFEEVVRRQRGLADRTQESERLAAPEQDAPLERLEPLLDGQGPSVG